VSTLPLTTLLEITGLIFGILGVLLTIRVSIWSWPMGVISTASYALLFLHIHLYADALLHLFFVTTGLVGWFRWLRKSNATQPFRVSYLSTTARKFTLLMTTLAIITASFVFSTFTDAHIPYLDSTASSIGATGQILQMQKKIECWYLWMVVNVMSVGIYIHKDVYLTACLYAFYCCFSVRGYLSWKKHLLSPVEKSAFAFPLPLREG